MTRLLLCAIFGLPVFSSLAAFAMAPAPPHDGGTKTKICYAASDDSDHDGYAKSGAPAVPLTIDKRDMTCPAGYVDYNNDGIDYDAKRHEYADEVRYNGIDEDQDGMRDETEYAYLNLPGDAPTQNSFVMYAKINDIRVTNAGANGSLYARVAYADLRDPGHLKFTGIHPAQVSNMFGAAVVKKIVTGLLPTTVYKAKVEFWLKGATGYANMYIPSDWYYTTTDGVSAKSLARTRILLRAFREWNESEHGHVGYFGSFNRDGTRYGASLNEKWCTEFNSWAAAPDLRDIGGINSFEVMIGYYEDRGAFYETNQIASVGDRGDYLAIDSDGDGSINHSGMFLALDTSTAQAKVWTLEGNSGNRVKIKERPLFSGNIKGLGHILSSMLK